MPTLCALAKPWPTASGDVRGSRNGASGSRYRGAPRLVPGKAGDLDEHVHARKGDADQEEHQQPQAQATRAPARMQRPLPLVGAPPCASRKVPAYTSCSLLLSQSSDACALRVHATHGVGFKPDERCKLVPRSPGRQALGATQRVHINAACSLLRDRMPKRQSASPSTNHA